jgi:hypothetical protein
MHCRASHGAFLGLASLAGALSHFAALAHPDPQFGDAHNFGVYPLALSNPIFFDVNMNGRYDPEHPHGKH